ncbi:MAG: hypothetical protein GX321_01190 [Clostridiales bacterium]|nr:hypothetical protein [Clostridiales bacterium]
MQKNVTHIIEMLIGAILIGLGLLYLTWQQRALTRLMDAISLDIVQDSCVIQQYNNTNIMQVTDKDVYVAIIGYRQCPIMVDANVIPLYGQDYELYFSYIKKGNYKKDYSYDADRNIIMIHFTYEGAG